MKVRKRKTKETNRPIFSKKSINEPNELNTSAVEIPMYAPNMGLAPKDYQLSPKLTELEETFEGICKAFLKAANPDMFNSSYMDAIIERTIVEALKFIRVQRCDHERLITENLMAMHKGDYCVVMSKHELCIADREDNEKANLLLVPIFSAMDGTVLYSIMEECFLQSALMSIVMAFGVAVVLNILPLVIAKFLHGAIYKTTKHGLTMCAVFVAGFHLVYGGTVYLRFAYSDMYEQENQSMTLENTVSEEKVENGTENVQEISEKRRKSMAVVTLLSISPLITSLLGFAIAYVSDDEIRRKVECLELEKIEIDEKISEIDAAIAQMEHYMEEGIERELTFDEQAMNAAEDEIIARGNVMKAQARFILAEFLSNPQATTKLSEEMLLKDKEPSVE